MSRTDNISLIEELAASQNGVFTAAQAESFGIPRYALSYAAKAGRIERICHGAYRLKSSIDEGRDELAAIWMLTNPGAFAHDRIANHDGIIVCATTAAALHGIGDFFLSPYQIAVPKRFNSRNKIASYTVLKIPEEDITWLHGLPVTTIERTIKDLAESDEDQSLVADALIDAIDSYGSTSFNIDRLEKIIGKEALQDILNRAEIGEGNLFELIRTDSLGHVAIKRRDR